MDDDKRIAEAVADERERVAALLEMHRHDLERADLYHRLLNLVRNGRDPREPDDAEDRPRGRPGGAAPACSGP